MSSQKQHFNTIALFLFEKRRKTAFNNSELLMDSFQSLIVSALKSLLKYFLAFWTPQWFITPTLHYWEKMN